MLEIIQNICVGIVSLEIVVAIVVGTFVLLESLKEHP